MFPSHIKALIIDMDGVIWRADTPIGNLAEIFTRIETRGLKYVFATNNGTKTPEQYVERLGHYKNQDIPQFAISFFLQPVR